MATTLFHNAKVYTLQPAQPTAEAFVVQNGTFLGVGDLSAMRDLAGSASKTVDLQGQIVMPGLIDSHVHHGLAGEEDLYHIKVSDKAGVDEILAKLEVSLADKAPGTWHQGGNFGSHLLAELSTSSALERFDQVTGDRPVLLMDDTHHNKWVNSAVLRAMGITDATESPEGGVIVRDATTGKATGLLYETAAALAQSALASNRTVDAEYHARCSERGMEIANQYGITAFQDAGASGELLAAVQKLDDEKRLSAWVVSSMLLTDFFGSGELVGQELFAKANNYKSPHHRITFAKIFLDGIPPSYTAAFLTPYVDSEQYGCNHKGAMTLSYDELDHFLEYFAKIGIGAKIHCTGDASVRAVLDATERIRGEHPNIKIQIAHGQNVHPDDIPRFSKLGVYAEISPSLWYPTIIGEACMRVRPRPEGERLQPNRSLLDAGALIGGGSDWSVSPTPNPWPAISGLITRADPEGLRPGTVWAEQAITRTEAIACFTTSAAKLIGLDDVIGRVAEGYSADFVVLDRDPFTVAISELAKTTAVQTWFTGSQVYPKGP